MCCSLVPLNSVNIYGEQNVWQNGNKMTLLHCRRCHFSLHHSQHCHHSFACNLTIDWANWQWQRFAEMHFYPPPLLLYCDTKITSCLQDIGKCHFLKMRWESHTSSSSGWQLWLHFRTLIDRFNSFLETEGHSDHRKPMWTVNCQPSDPVKILQSISYSLVSLKI